MKTYAVQLSKLLLLAVFFIPAGCGSSAQPEIKYVKRNPWISQGEWIKVDTHIHTKFSDGANTVSELVQKAQLHGCQAIAITDHGDRELKAATLEYEQAIEAARREFPEMVILAGLEWNVPPWGGDVHATVLFPQNENEWGNLAQFKRFYDDHNRSEHNTELREDAMRWLDQIGERTKTPPVIILNHPSRKVDTGEGVAEIMRDWMKNDDLLIGFSGAPGHQAMDPQGAFDEIRKLKDRWDPAAAIVEDAWDTLLKEGYTVYAARAASDFYHHRENNRNGYDFWPGEFSETWLYVPRRTAEGVLKAFRAGSFFANHGHIVRQVSLTISTSALGRPGYAGETIQLAEGSQADVQLTFRVPTKDWQGNANKIDEVEFIAITKTGSHVIARGPPDDNQFATTITIPEDGVVIRARGRNIVSDGPDLMFYTNPIRVVTSASTVASSVTLENWFPFLLAIPALVISILLFRLFKRPPAAKTKTTHRGKRKVVETKVVKSQPTEFSLKLMYSVFSVLLAGFIVYGSLLPFKYHAMPFSEAVSQFRQILFEAPAGKGRIDFLTNFLLYVPLGFFLCEVWIGTRKTVLSTLFKVTTIFFGCLFLSVSVEFAQIWYSDRVPSRFDILANFLGTLAGIFTWIIIGERIRMLSADVFSEKPWQSKLNSFLIAYMLIIFLISIVPLDLSIHPADLFEKYKEGKIQPIPFADITKEGEMLKKFLFHLLLFAPMGILNTLRFRQRGFRSSASLQASLLQGFLFVMVTEFSQVIVMKRYALATDIVMGTIAVLLGSILVLGIDKKSSVDSRKTLPQQWLWFSFTLLYLIVPMVYYWYPFLVEENTSVLKDRVSDFFVLPFSRLQSGSNMRAYGHMLHCFFFLIPFGILLAKFSSVRSEGSWSCRSRLIVSTILIVSIAFILEWGQLFLNERIDGETKARIADVTSVLISITGALLGLFLSYSLIFRTLEIHPTTV